MTDRLSSLVYGAPPAAKEPTGPALPFQQEVRATSPSGGQKGKKPERYDLIPAEFQAEVEVLADANADRIRRLVDLFWRLPRPLFPARDSLVTAAAVAADALGGIIATRFYVARVYGQGALKYDDDNWKRGYPWSWSYAALRRHLEAITRGELLDPESGLPHYAHVWWHCATLWWFDKNGVGTDDRPKEVK